MRQKLRLSEVLPSTKWLVRFVSEGVSKVNVYFSRDVLKQAEKDGIFEDVDVGMLELKPGHFNHLPDKYEDVTGGMPRGNIVGRIWNVRYQSEPTPGLYGVLELDSNGLRFRDQLERSWRKLELSVNIYSEFSPMIHAGKIVRRVDQILRAETVDIVSHSAADGKFLKIVASEGANIAFTRDELAALFRSCSKRELLSVF